MKMTAEECKKYLSECREEFAQGLEEAARLMREGTVDDVADFVTKRRLEIQEWLAS